MTLWWNKNAGLPRGLLRAEHVFPRTLQLAQHGIQTAQGDRLLAPFQSKNGGRRQANLPGKLRERHVPTLIPQPSGQLFVEDTCHPSSLGTWPFHMRNVFGLTLLGSFRYGPGTSLAQKPLRAMPALPLPSRPLAAGLPTTKVRWQRWALLGSILAVILYLLSPYVSLWSLRTALETGDDRSLATHVDFPSVRASLKEQLRARLTKSGRAEKDPGVGGSVFGAAADALTSLMVDRAVDTLVTPSGLRALLAGSRWPLSKEGTVPTPLTNSHQPAGQPHVRYAFFTGPTRFLVDLDGTRLRFGFTGLRWELEQLELPPSLPLPWFGLTAAPPAVRPTSSPAPFSARTARPARDWSLCPPPVPAGSASLPRHLRRFVPGSASRPRAAAECSCPATLHGREENPWRPQGADVPCSPTTTTRAIHRVYACRAMGKGLKPQAGLSRKSHPHRRVVVPSPSHRTRRRMGA